MEVRLQRRRKIQANWVNRRTVVTALAGPYWAAMVFHRPPIPRRNEGGAQDSRQDKHLVQPHRVEEEGQALPRWPSGQPSEDQEGEPHRGQVLQHLGDNPSRQSSGHSGSM